MTGGITFDCSKKQKSMKLYTFKILFITVTVLITNFGCSHCDDEDTRKKEKVQALTPRDTIKVQDL